MKYRHFIYSLLVFLACIASVPKIYADRVIYETITSPILDQGAGNEAVAFLMALGGSGKTTITDKGNGTYFMKITMGGQNISDNLTSPKVVNSKLIQFRLGTQGNTLITITPEKIDLGGKMEFVVASSDAFNTLLKNLGGVKSSGPSSSSKASSSAQSLPSKGEVSVRNFVSHPFGFLTTNVTTMQDALKQLRAAGWSAKINTYPESTQICIISSTPFRIPMKLYGKDISVMSAYGTETGRILKYGIEVSDFKTNWTQDEAIAFAKRIVKELEGLGYKQVEDPYIGNNFFLNQLKGDGVYQIEVQASQSSKYETLDSYGVRFEVWRAIR